MEEAELLKKRLQAITNKRKIQEEITSKRLEIDKEKLKLQQLKKKSVRDLWLLGGTSSGAVQKEQKVQDVTQQTKALQSSIHQIEKEIEALEREELKISTNEGVILNRLKVIEKSTEDIIKAANEKFKSEPKHFHSGIPDVQKSYTPFNMRKQSNVALGTKTDQQKPALFAMEINVQKDLCTGESRVLSTSTVPAQESQKHGIKVYDDGRKSVYALHSALDQPKADEVDELSPKEVEDLLRQARARRKKLQKQNEPLCFEDYQTSHCSQLYNMNMCDWPELEHTFSSLHYPYQEIHEPVHMLHHYREQHKYYHNSKAKSFEMDEDEIRNDSVQTCNPQEQHKRTRSQLGGSVMNRIPDLSREDPKLTGLNNLPSNNPVTMIFMGYQNAEEDAQGCDHSIQAELVIIKDEEEEEEEALTSASAFKNRYIHTPMNGNTNNMSTHLTTEEMFPASMNSQAV